MYTILLICVGQIIVLLVINNRIIICYGKISTGRNDASVTINFPISYSSANISIFITYNVDGTGNYYYFDAKVRSYSKTQFYVYVNPPNSFWMSIGY